nr:hypothetical protein [Tanacetum cinerariifolium]
MKCLMLPPNNLGPDELGVSVNETLFRDMIKSLMYLIASRPDIKISTCLCARKSASVGCKILGGKLTCWSAKKQSSVAMSSAEAEYVVTAGCCAQVFWIKSQLAGYDVLYDKNSKSLILSSGKVNNVDSTDNSLSGTNVQPLTQESSSTPQVTDTQHAEKTVATTDDTQSIDASESAEELRIQPQTTNAKKVQKPIDEEIMKDSKLKSMGNVTFDDLPLGTDDSPYDTESGIK